MGNKSIPLFTAKYRAIRDKEGFRFTFFCELCDSGYTTPLIPLKSLKDALNLGKWDARLHFNRCECCHRWVCDEHFNENRMMCTDCIPRICDKCGSAVPKGNQFCTACGAPQFETDSESGKERMEGNE